MCLSALVSSGNTPTLQPFKCNFPNHPRGGRGWGKQMTSALGHFQNIHIQLDSEAERTKTIETSCNEGVRY